MHLPAADDPTDPAAARAGELRSFVRALRASMAFVALLVVVYLAQGSFPVRPFAVAPGTAAGLVGLMTAPLLHGSLEHIVANAVSVLMLGTLAGGVYPRATPRALPLLWLGSGLGAWLLGEPGSHHLGASGLTHGLMFLVFSLGVLRRDRPAIAAAMLGFMFYGGMLLTVLPREPGVSWQSHLGGAVAGILAAWLLRRRDPVAPRRRYSWEIEDELAEEAARERRDQFEPPSPHDVPVLWTRDEAAGEERGTVLPFPPRRP
jgi:membrane associated rhomboid family serine protease